MRIAICGASTTVKPACLKLSYELGKAIAKAGIVLVMGAGCGYPLEAAKGSFHCNGKVIAVSPARNKAEHVGVYGFQTDYFTQVIYTGEGIPRRNYSIIENSDSAIMIGGQIGTLNEFSIAFHRHKPIGVLKGSGGITCLLPEIAKICEKDFETRLIVYEDAPEALLNKLLSLMHKNKPFP